MKRFYLEGQIGDEVALSPRESAHILKVYRMKAGDKLILFDDSPYEYLCEIAGTEGGIARARVLEKRENPAEPGVCITLYQAVLKGDKLEYALQKCVELGASGFVPFFAERCVKILDEKGREKLRTRMEKIAIESVKQCRRAKIPKVEAAVSFDEMLTRISKHDYILFAYECETRRIGHIPEDVKNIAVIIGPEGGFAPGEAEKIKQTGAVSIGLGPRILRADTAAIAMTAILSYELQL